MFIQKCNQLDKLLRAKATHLLVCEHVRVSMCVRVHVRVSMCACEHVCVSMCTCERVPACEHERMCERVLVCVCVGACVRVCVSMCTCVWACVCASVCLHACVHVACAHSCIHGCVETRLAQSGASSLRAAGVAAHAPSSGVGERAAVVFHGPVPSGRPVPRPCPRVASVPRAALGRGLRCRPPGAQARCCAVAPAGERQPGAAAHRGFTGSPFACPQPMLVHTAVCVSSSS